MTNPNEVNALYRESMTFRVMTVISVVMGIFSASMLGLVIYNFAVKPIDKDPAIGWVLLGDAALFAFLTWFIQNFRVLEIILTYDGLIVKFGKIRKTVAWSDIEAFKVIDKGLELGSGGWHFGLVRGGWSTAYTVMGKPRVGVRVRTGRIREVMFSTANPEEVVKTIRGRVGPGVPQEGSPAGAPKAG